MSRPLLPDEMFPAGIPSISTRQIRVRRGSGSGIQLRVLESGPADGDSVVLLHGWGASSYSFRHALSLLPKRGFRAIAIDLRGFGLSERPMRRGQYLLDDYCADLDDALAALSVSRPSLVGHSMGGGVALHYALRAPACVARIALINPVGLVPLGILGLARLSPRWPFRVLDRYLTPRWMIRLILRHVAYGNANLVTDDVIDEYWSPTQLPGFSYAVRATVDEFEWAPISDPVAASLAVPCVVILGEADRLVQNSSAAANRLASAAVYQFAGGHCVHEEDPARVYEIIAQFAGK